MAKAKNKDKYPPFNFNDEVKKLNKQGLKRLYFIWGPEDYLSDLFVEEIRKLCVPEDVADFSYHRFSERDYSARALADAIDSVPFLTERTMVEVRGLDLNKLLEEEVQDLGEALKEIPDYCTVVFVEPSEFEPDKRKKVYKILLRNCCELYVSEQQNDALVGWVVKRFAAEGKRIETNAIQRLLFISGSLMNMLIPEISKIAGYAKGDVVTVADVDAVAHHVPDAIVFDMMDSLSVGEVGKAMYLFDDLLADKSNTPEYLISIFGSQVRRLFGAKMAIECGDGADYLRKYYGVNLNFAANKLMNAARRYSVNQLKRFVELCAETEYIIKNATALESKDSLKECVMRIAMGEGDE